MVRTTFGKISWRYALGEIALIFVGITMAIWFNNWNESRKARIVEIKSLKEIQEAINQDLTDIEENIAGFTNRVKLYTILIKHMDDKLPSSSELKDRFPYLRGITTFLSNIGPYETLKSRGLGIISNDTLRTKVSLYYDLEYEKIQTNEKQHHDHYRAYLKPMMLINFDLSKPKIDPFDYEDLMANNEFKQIIYWALGTDSYMLENYKIMEEIGKELTFELENEIIRLE